MDFPDSIRALYPFRPHYIEIGPHRLHYVDEGRGEPILFLHGNPTWSFYYRNLIRTFSATHRCIAPDHVGCGLSDKPQDYPYHLQTHIDNIVLLVDYLQLKKFTLVMHDWGGAIGMGMALRRQDFIRRLVVFNAAAFHSSRIPPSIAFCKLPLLGSFAVRRLNLFSRAAVRWCSVRPGKMTTEIKNGYLGPYDSFANRVAVHRFVKDIPLHRRHPSYAALTAVENALPRFANHPALILWGKDDFCFDESFYNAWRKKLPHAEAHLFPDAGHFVVEDALDEITPILTRFLLK